VPLEYLGDTAREGEEEIVGYRSFGKESKWLHESML
jgi:hypothetical protein